MPEVCPSLGCQEPFSALSHLFGAMMFVYLGLLLMRRAGGDRPRQLLLGMWAAGTVLMFLTSGIYHALTFGTPERRIMQRADHCAIFFLLICTYTAAHGVLMRGWLRWGPPSIVGAASVAGIFLKAMSFDAVPEGLGLSIFIILGWLGVVSGVLFAYRFGASFIAPLMWGGVAFTIGAVLDFYGWVVLIPGYVHPHELFHIATLTGAFCHYCFFWQFARSDFAALYPLAA